MKKLEALKKNLSANQSLNSKSLMMIYGGRALQDYTMTGCDVTSGTGGMYDCSDKDS